MRDLLFEPVRINRMEIKNRIYMPAMHLNMAQKFEVTDPLVDFYAERARGGAGMIAVGYATVDEFSGSAANIGAHADAFIPGLARLAAAIRENGARAVLQINHAGRYNFSFFIDGRQPVAPSAVASRMTGETPRALELDEIPEVIGRFAAAARRAQQAGYDGVEVLAGTGYLISEFLSPLTNLRTDAYGGPLVNRMRFGLEVIEAVRGAVGANYPILVRMNGNDFMPGGNGRADLQAFAQALVAAGADALNINVGWHEARVPQIVTAVPRGVYAYLARGIRELVGVPVAAGHRINDPRTAREMIAEGMCDFVAMGRALIADPYLPAKAAEGREATILHCVACAQGCFDNLFKLKPVECLCNPRAGREGKTTPAKARIPRKVMVVGGGAGGMSAALAAREAGHAVTLYEQRDRLGGQLLLAGAPPGRGEFVELARNLRQQIARSGVAVVLNRPVDPALIETAKPDVVILATGAVPVKPPLPGADLPHVVQAWDVLSERAATGRRVVVVGGGAVGVETAQYLAEKGTLSGEAVKFLLVNRAEDSETLYGLAVRGTKTVTLIEMIDKLGKEIGRTTRWGMLQDLTRSGVHTRTSARVLEITPSGLKIETGGVTEEIQADTVVLAIGAASHNPLEDVLKQKGIPCRVVGDARKPGWAFDAIHQGFEAGRTVE
jgi:2,4-dienoyl-CoA reductase (NADPH2)